MLYMIETYAAYFMCTLESGVGVFVYSLEKLGMCLMPTINQYVLNSASTDIAP